MGMYSVYVQVEAIPSRIYDSLEHTKIDYAVEL